MFKELVIQQHSLSCQTLFCCYDFFFSKKLGNVSDANSYAMPVDWIDEIIFGNKIQVRKTDI
jgi:hypothetical protein